jgi:thioesterase domain-containing protein
MTSFELVASLRQRDVRLWIENDRLKCSAPAGALAGDLKAVLASRKDEIIALLRHAEAVKSGPSAIIPLKPRGSRPPLFAIPGHNGDVFCYRALAGHLDEEQPLLGVQPPGLDGGEPTRSIADLARYELDQIRQCRPEGPYLIAGYCAGGTLAFEVARQLNEQGQQVGLLALFGSPFPISYRWPAQAAFRAGAAAERARRHLRSLACSPLAEGMTYLRARIEQRRAARATRVRQLHDPTLESRRRVEDATIAAVRRYRLRRYSGRIDLFIPSEAWRRWGGRPHQWKAVADTLCEHVGPDGCHTDVMLKEPYAATLAAALRPLLAWGA